MMITTETYIVEQLVHLIKLTDFLITATDEVLLLLTAWGFCYETGILFCCSTYFGLGFEFFP